MATGSTTIRHALSIVAWVATTVLGVFLMGGALGFIKGIVQDYTPVEDAFPMFVFSLALAIWLSPPSNAPRRKTDT